MVLQLSYGQHVFLHLNRFPYEIVEPVVLLDMGFTQSGPSDR